MQNKKTPLRMCVACKESKPKRDLFRIVRYGDNYSLDIMCNSNGRGAYICKNKDCIQKTIKSKILNKSFKQNIPDDVYDLLKENIFE